MGLELLLPLDVPVAFFDNSLLLYKYNVNITRQRTITQIYDFSLPYKFTYYIVYAYDCNYPLICRESINF